MNIKRSLRKIAELGVGLTAIATLILAGCGGGGLLAAATTTISGVLVAGPFQNATVEILDKNNNRLALTQTNASGVFTTTISATAQGPFVVRGGKANEQFFDEGANASAVVPASSVAGDGFALHAVISDTATLIATTGITVSTITERMAAAVGLTAAGTLPASAIPMIKTKNDAYTQLYGFNPVTTPPTLVTSSAVLAALPSATDKDKYAQLLAAEAKLAPAGKNAMTVARELAEAIREVRAVSSALVTPVTGATDPDDFAIKSLPSGITLSASAVITSGTLRNWISAADMAASAVPGMSEVDAEAAKEALFDAFKDSEISAAAAAAQAQTAALAMQALSPTNLANASAVQAAMTAALQAAASGLSPASAIAAATTQATAATPIAAAKALLASLRNEAILLHNADKTGFIDTQVSGVKADFSGLFDTQSRPGTFNGNALGDWKRAMKHGVQLLQINATVGTGVMVLGTNPCGVTANGTAVCQWITSSQTDWATHQLTITSAGTGTCQSGTNQYCWSDLLIGAGSWSTASPTLLNTTPPAPGTALTGNTAQTGTATVVGSFASGTVTSLSFSGNIQPGFAPTTTHDHTAIALNGTETTDNTNNTNTFAVSGSIAEVNSSGASIVSLAISSGSNFVDVSATGTPVFVHLVTQAKTPKYQFDGTVDMSGFARDASTTYPCGSNPLACNTTPVSSPKWYPGAVSFTGSVTGIGSNASVGKFMTGTLSRTRDYTPATGYPGLNQNAYRSSTNYPKMETGSFVGSIINGSATYSVNFTETDGNTSTTYNDRSYTLTYTDPKNTVTMNTKQTSGSPATGTVTMGGITIVFDGSSSIVYSGYTSSTAPGTLIGTTSGSIVSFIDGTTASLQ